MMIAAVATIALAAGPSGGNMNADAPYRIANAAAANPNKSFGFRGRYFELESPMITSKYSQVFWRGLGVVPLPADVVKEYDGKIMAITGFEVDVLRNTSKGVERVPCYESYNHHYAMSMHGAGVDIEYVEEWAPAQNSHGGPRYVTTPNGKDSGTYSTQSFNEHNGNEARQTYHGMPNGYVVPLESPRSWTMSPMQINTRNPSGSGKRCIGGEAACPLPKRQNSWKGAPWNGILECPCTTRAVKTFDYVKRTTSDIGCTFNSSLAAAQECFTAAAAHLSPSPAPEIWTCSQCHHVYDAAKDDPAQKNTPFEKLPATWKCPVCGAPKTAYKKTALGWVHEHAPQGGEGEQHNVTVHDSSKPFGCYVEGSSAVFNTAANSTASCDSLPAGGGCICRGTTGYIEHEGKGKRRFSAGCLGEPKSDLIKTHNPTCE